jgi:hypothetical protein
VNALPVPFPSQNLPKPTWEGTDSLGGMSRFCCNYWGLGQERQGMKEAGELGFEPSFVTSTSQGNDTELTFENLAWQAFTTQPAPIYIVAAVG